MPFGSARSSRRRPTTVDLPPSVSRSRRTCGRNGSSLTVMRCLGAARGAILVAEYLTKKGYIV